MPGVRVLCLMAYAPGGQTVRVRSAETQAEMKTDQDGRFVLHLAVSTPKPGQIGSRIPPNTIHHLRLLPPDDHEQAELGDDLQKAGLEAADHLVSNAAPATLVLKRFTIERDIEVEQEDGLWAAGPGAIERIGVMREPTAPFDAPTAVRSPQFAIQRDIQKDGHASFSPGRYSFGSIYAEKVITEDSPDPVRVSLLHRTACTGRVVDAVTGEPLEGAFVITSAGYSPGDRVAGITPAMWDLLESMPQHPEADHPAMAVLKRFLTRPRVVRTDADGRYRVEVPGDAIAANHVVHAAARDRTVDAVGNSAFAEQPGVLNELPVLRLAPAATIEVAVFSSVRGEGRLHWRLAEGREHPEWARGYEAADVSR